MTVLVLGSSGQLATHLREHLPDAEFWGRADLDLTEPTALADAIMGRKPELIINAAAYTAVDKAETERAAAWQLNAAAPALAARAAAALGIPILHISTDYVFDGRKTSPYAVGDATGPVNTYGVTKLAGETAVRTLCGAHWILRTSWAFSEHGANFVKTMLRLAAKGGNLRVVADQQGTPTYADDLAMLAARLARAPASLGYGTYHAVGGPATTWHGFATRIIERAQARRMLPAGIAVEPIATADYPTAARRPANSVLAPSVELSRTGARFDWERGLERVLSRLEGSCAG